MGNNCCVCGKEIMPGEPFILEGKYPTGFSKWFKPAFLKMVQLDWYGKLYHKQCFKK